MINMDAVPQKNPAGVIPPGTYKLTVTKTQMKQPKDLQKPMYMVVNFKAEGTDGTQGTFEDKFFDSDSSYIMFKLTRFLQAVDINLSGQVELKDIEKLVNPGLQAVAVITNQDNEWNGKTTTNAEVDIFNSDCYYPVSEWAKFKGDADDPFEQAQAQDATPETDTSNNY